MHDNDPEVLESEKRKNLSKTQHQTSTPHKEAAPGWNEHLASASEAAIKAMRNNDNTTPEELQRQTVDYIQSRHSPEDRLGARETDVVDEVTGPLGSVDIHADGHGRTIKRKTIHEETEEVISVDPTSSEEAVKADRGNY